MTVAQALRIVLACPKCAGPFEVDDETVTCRCPHCGSLLLLSAPERDEIYFVEGQVHNAVDLLDIVILYRLEAYRAELVGRYKDDNDNPPSEYFIEKRLGAYESQLRQTSRLVDAHCFQVPYWHISGWLVQGTLARPHGDGPKLVRLRGYAVQQTVAGYDQGKANFRDRGLKLSTASVHPLTVRETQNRGVFLPWVADAQRSYREIDRWRGRELDPGMESIAKQATFLLTRRILLYRPYWLIRFVTHEGPASTWIDGSFATIAGHPDEPECRRLLTLPSEDPLHSGQPSFRDVHSLASRCPDCGFEQSFDSRFRVAACGSCHRGLRPTPAGIELVHYDHALWSDETALDGQYVPFWRFEFTMRIAGAPEVRQLEDYVRIVFPAGVPLGFHASGKYLFVPAFRLLGTEVGDEVFKGLVEWIHGTPPRIEEGKIPLGGDTKITGVSVSQDEAADLVPFVLLGIHTKSSAAHLNTLLVKRVVQDAKISLSNPSLVMMPFTSDMVGHGVDVNLLLSGERHPVMVHEGP